MRGRLRPGLFDGVNLVSIKFKPQGGTSDAVLGNIKIKIKIISCTITL